MESYEEVLKRIRGYKGESQTPQSGVVSNKYEDVLSRIRGYENEVVQPAVPNTTVPTTVSPTQTQPEKRSFGEGTKRIRQGSRRILGCRDTEYPSYHIGVCGEVRIYQFR